MSFVFFAEAVRSAAAAWAKNRLWSNSGRAAKAGRSVSGMVHVTRKYGTGRSRPVCFCVHAAVLPRRSADRPGGGTCGDRQTGQTGAKAMNCRRHANGAGFQTEVSN
jgi:hypothetical protein